jgi:hypothetical protein
VVSIVVAGAGADQASMVLALGIQIPVNVREDFISNDSLGSGSMRVGNRTFELKGPRLYLNISLEPVDDFSELGSRGLRPPTTPNDESMVIDNVAPGRYWVRIRFAGGYAQAVTSGGVDVLHEPLVVTSGSQSPIEIVVRDDAAGLEGTVAGVGTVQGGARLSDAAYAFRQGPSAFIYCVPLAADSSGQYQELVASPDGKFDWTGFAPGVYRVLVFPHPQPNLPYRDPLAMRAYESQGQVVRLVPGQKEHLQLQLSSGE